MELDGGASNERVSEVNGPKLSVSLRCLVLFVLLATEPAILPPDGPLQVNAESHAPLISLDLLRPVKTVSDLVNRLRDRGNKIGHGGKISQPFLSVPGRIITIDGEDVQVFQYANAKSAEREVKAIDLQGSPVGTSMPTWVAPPHFYKSSSLIVLYIGQNSSVMRALEGALGPQFAGK